MVVPDTIEPVVAWRAWHLTRPGGRGPHRLDSVIHDCVWPAREELLARCLNARKVDPHGHFAPARSCQCGIYGTQRFDTLRNYLGYGDLLASQVRVVGLVSLWGDVVEHEYAWRASHAYPRRLWLPVRTHYGELLVGWELIAGDLLEYGVPVETLDAGTIDEVVDALEGWWARSATPRAA